MRHAELRGHLLPAQPHGLLDDDLGDLGEVVADAHQRNRSGEIGHGHAEYRGALELPQHLHLPLRLVLGRGARAAPRPRARARRAATATRRTPRPAARRAAADARRSAPPGTRRSAASSTSLRRTCAFSLSSAKYAEREPMASSTLSTRRRTSSCVPEASPPARSAIDDSNRGTSVSRRARPGASSRLHRAGAAKLQQQLRGALRHPSKPRAASAAANGAAARAAQPGFGDAVDAGRLGARRVVAREHDFLKRARDPRAMQVELGAAGLPVAETHRRARCARASAHRPGWCASARRRSICRRFSRRRRNR